MASGHWPTSTDIGGDQHPSVATGEDAGLTAPLQLLESADGVVEIAGLERESAQCRLGRGQEGHAGIDFLDRLVADDLFEGLGGLGDGAGAAVELGLPELDHLVVGVLLQGLVEVIEGVGDLAAFDGDLGVEDVGGRGLLPASPDLVDDGRGLVEPVLLQLEAGELDHGIGAVGPLGDASQELACLVRVLEALGLDLGPQDHDLDVVGLVAQERLEDVIGLLGLAVPDQEGRIESGQLGAPRIASSALLRGAPPRLGLPSHPPRGSG